MNIPLDSAETAPFEHLSVLSAEMAAGLSLESGQTYLDATAGGGGHSWALLTASPHINLILIDRDPQALAAARERLAPFLERIQFWGGNFADFPGTPQSLAGIIADLGVSSPQLDQPERGFSFRHSAPLDMRMDPGQALTAAEIVNHDSETDLARIFWEYGEERLSRRLARRIVERRPLQTTAELADIIAGAVPPKYRYGRIHPATRVFQALRIAVNDELGSLTRFLEQAPHWLQPGGRIGIISFHSLEDRLVKHRFREHPQLKVLTKKPILAGAEELAANPRARSAKLRWAERLS